MDKKINLHTLLLEEEGVPKSVIIIINTLIRDGKDHLEAGKVETAFFFAFNRKKERKKERE